MTVSTPSESTKLSSDDSQPLREIIERAQIELDILVQTGDRRESIMYLVKALSAVRKFVHPSLYKSAAVGPFHKYLSEDQKQELVGRIGYVARKDGKDFDEDVAVIGMGRALQIISDGIATAVGSVYDVTPRAFLIELAEEITALSASRIAGESTRISKTRMSQDESVGATAQSELAKGFAQYASRQMHTSLVWLAGAAAFTPATVIVAFRLLQSGELAWQALVGHLLVALPLLAFAAYCARESSRHREASRWAGRLAVQLKSVSAYCNRLDDDDRRKLLTAFGHYVFGPHASDGVHENQLNTVPPELWSALSEAVRSRLGG